MEITAESPRRRSSASSSPEFEFWMLRNPPSSNPQLPLLSADELFSDGKLVPLHLSTPRPSAAEIRSSAPETSVVVGSIFSPKAPRCTTRWRELLGFKKAFPDPAKPADPKTPGGGRPFRHLLLLHHHHSKPSADPSLALPLLRGIDREAVASSISTRLSLSSSSSSSGLDHDDLPRLSLDSDRARNPLRVRIARPRPAASDDGVRGRAPPRGASVDSPRMDPSGRIIFKGLERSSSSPGSFNGRPRAKYRGMERSFSAHVRVPSVLNVPVCSRRGGSSKPASVFGFGQLFSQARKERVGSAGKGAAAAAAAGGGGGKKKGETDGETERIRARRESGGG